jgi:hypothetical protein
VVTEEFLAIWLSFVVVHWTLPFVAAIEAFPVDYFVSQTKIMVVVL